jgi:methionyl-tRNA formyltransferase
MSKSTPLIFFGTEGHSSIVLTQLAEAGYNVVAVITKPDHKSGRGQKLTAPKVKQIAEERNIEVWQPNSLDDIRDKITEIKCDWAVLVAYGKIIPQRILDLFNGGIINVHPSLLPHYRGPSPVEATIVNGDSESGVSIMKLTAEMDAGPVYSTKTVALDGSETKPSLYTKLFSLGGELLVENLDKIIDGSLAPSPQDDTKATYCQLLGKDDGLIDSTQSAEVYEREVRAYQGYPKSTAALNNQRIIITKARVASSKDNGELILPCKDSFLEILELTAPSGKTMSGAEFIRGYSLS